MFSFVMQVNYSYHNWNYVGIAEGLRVYPLRTGVGKLFAGFSVGYGYYWDGWSVQTIRLSAKGGWRIIYDSGFFIEPIVTYSYPFVMADDRKNFKNSKSSDFKIKHGIGVCLNIGFAF